MQFKTYTSLTFLLAGVAMVVSLPTLTTADEDKQLTNIEEQTITLADNDIFGPHRAKQLFDSMDHDRNQQLSFAEFKRTNYPLNIRTFVELDGDANGALDRREFDNLMFSTQASSF